MLPQADQPPGVAGESINVPASVATVGHVINPYVALDELYQIAKADAVLICSVPNYAYLKHRIALLFGKHPRTGTGFLGVVVRFFH